MFFKKKKKKTTAEVYVYQSFKTLRDHIIIQLPKLQYETFVRGRFNLRRSNKYREYHDTYVLGVWKCESADVCYVCTLRTN